MGAHCTLAPLGPEGLSLPNEYGSTGSCNILTGKAVEVVRVVARAEIDLFCANKLPTP